ncbi:mitochondrial amidoxime reducing component 2-like protein [Tanacetum coccineum]
MHEEYVIRCCIATKFLAMEDDDVSSKSFLDEATGFVWDRHLVVVNSKGRGCTQRVKPELARIQVELPTEAFSIGWVPTKSSYMAPPRSTYQVASLPLDSKVECIADFLAPATSSCAVNTADAAWGVASRVIGLAKGAITGAANVAERTVGAVKGTSVILLTHNNV